MHIPLVVDQSEYGSYYQKYLHRLRKVKRIMEIHKAESNVLKIVTTSMFFSTRISHVIRIKATSTLFKVQLKRF